MDVLCPICSAQAQVAFTRRGQPASVHMPPAHTMDLAVAGCRSCDFFWNVEAFADPEGFSAWMAPAYQSYTLLDNDLHGFPLVDERTRTAERFLDAQCPWKDMGHVLEVGSNRGDFLAYLQQRHPHLHLMGIESTPLSLVGVPTLFHDVHQVRLSPSFDLVMARQVLEHMTDPERFLARLASFAREDGWVLMEVPALEVELDEGVDPWVLEHVGHYSERALELLGRRVGLELAATDKSYQMSALFRKTQAGGAPWTTVDNARWDRLPGFLARVEATAKTWRHWAEQGGELCFYGASNVFLAITAELRQLWGEEFWSRCRLSLADDSPGRLGQVVGGLKVEALDGLRPERPALYVVCAMYRYHRMKMVPRVRGRMRAQDRLFAMWTPLQEGPA